MVVLSRHLATFWLLNKCTSQTNGFQEQRWALCCSDSKESQILRSIKRDDTTSFSFQLFIHVWKDINNYICKSVALPGRHSLGQSQQFCTWPHFVPLYNCGENDTSNDLACPWPGQMVGWIGFPSFWGGKNDWNLKSLHKSCTLWGLLKIIKIPGRGWFKAVKHEELPIKDPAALVEWSLTHSLWAAQKHITYSFWQVAEAWGHQKETNILSDKQRAAL